jgi:excisionase family DNA binding protein
MERYLTVDETADTLRVHADTVRRWLRSGRLRAVKFGKAYRIPESHLRQSHLLENVDDRTMERQRADDGTPDIHSQEDGWQERLERTLALMDAADANPGARPLKPMNAADDIEVNRAERTMQIESTG